MNLFKYDFSKATGYVYINNVDLIAFLSFWGTESAIKINSFNGHLKNEYYYLEDLADVRTIFELIKYFLDKEGILINDLDFVCGTYRCYINDMYEYAVYSEIDNIKKVISYLLKELIDINENHVLETLRELEGKYVLLDRGQIMKIFDTFEEYQSSPF